VQQTCLIVTWNDNSCIAQVDKKVKVAHTRLLNVPELIPVLGSQPTSDVSHKPGGRLPLLSARPAVTLATLKRAATNSLLGEQRHDGCEYFA